MAKSLSQALSRTTGARRLPSRNRSTSPEPPAIYHGYKVGPDSDSDADGAIRRMEDAVHRIIAKKSQPDWFSFRPGSSYWVPPNTTKSRQFGHVSPKSPNSVANHFFKGETPLTSSKHNTTQSEEEES